MSYNENELLARLDELYEAEDYEEIEAEICKIPREKLSLKLRFRLVDALNNLKKFDRSLAELTEIDSLRKTPEDNARFFYYIGYVRYLNDREMLASHCFKRALAADPDDAAGLHLRDIIEECDGFISRDLVELKGFGRAAVEAVHARCAEIAEKDRTELSEVEFTLYLGYLSGIRKIDGIEKPLLFDNPLKKYTGEEKTIAAEFLKKYFGITDKESFLKFYHSEMKYNLYFMARDVLSYLDRTPDSPADKVDAYGRELLDDCAEYFNAIRECMTENTVLAWDISEKIGIARHCYACDLLTDSDFFGCMQALTGTASSQFVSFEEYMISLIMGHGFFMFLEEKNSIKSALNFMNMVLPMLLQSPLATFKWR